MTMISNLSTPGPPGGGIPVGTLSPRTGFGVGFVTGNTASTLSSVTLEFYGYSPVGFHVQLYTFGPPGSATPPGWPLVLYGELDQVSADPRPTLWPGQTAFLDFSSSATISLTPHSAYVIAATEDAAGNDNNGLRFGESENYNVAADWRLYLLQNMNQWYLDPNVGGWVNSGRAWCLKSMLPPCPNRAG